MGFWGCSTVRQTQLRSSQESFDRFERHPALQRLGDVLNSGRYPEAGVSEPSTPVIQRLARNDHEPWTILTIWLMVIPSIIEGSLEAKLPTIWTVETQSREEAERRERLEERRGRCAKR